MALPVAAKKFLPLFECVTTGGVKSRQLPAGKPGGSRVKIPPRRHAAVAAARFSRRKSILPYLP